MGSYTTTLYLIPYTWSSVINGVNIIFSQVINFKKWINGSQYELDSATKYNTPHTPLPNVYCLQFHMNYCIIYMLPLTSTAGQSQMRVDTWAYPANVLKAYFFKSKCIVQFQSSNGSLMGIKRSN